MASLTLTCCKCHKTSTVVYMGGRTTTPGRLKKLLDIIDEQGWSYNKDTFDNVICKECTKEK